jgi:hypothetical protein
VLKHIILSERVNKNVSHLKVARFLLLPPCRGKVGMGVEILIAFMLDFYPLPIPPPTWGGNDVAIF